MKKVITINPAERLGFLLRLIEQRLWLANRAYLSHINLATSTAPINSILLAKSQLQGAVVNYEKIRQRIMSSTDITPNEFTIPTATCEGEFAGKGKILETFPAMLQDWCKAGRRAYMLTPDMQKILEIASVGRIKWKDITFPFPSFVIRLPIPIMINGDVDNDLRPLDTIIVTRKNGDLVFLVVGGDIERWRPISPQFIKDVDGFVHKKKWNKVRRAIASISRKDLFVPSCVRFNIPLEWETNVQDIADEDINVVTVNQLTAGEIASTMISGSTKSHVTKQEQMPDQVHLLIRIVVGLCLHLTTGTNSAVTQWEKLGNEITEWHSVSDPNEICEVGTTYTLSELEEQVHAEIRAVGLKKALTKMSIHGRIAHWRRPPGKGSDLEHPQSVYVRWTLVGVKHLVQGNIPASSGKIV